MRAGGIGQPSFAGWPDAGVPERDGARLLFQTLPAPPGRLLMLREPPAILYDFNLWNSC